MISIVLFIGVILIVFFFLLAAAGVKSKTNGGEDMIKNVYIYLVLFATLMMTIGGSVAAFMALADMVAPPPFYQSFEEYSRWGGEKPVGDTTEKLTEAELRANYEAAVQSHRATAMERSKNSLVKSFGWIIIPLPIFIYFQRRLNSAKE
ncbi:hypothetical protein DS745_24240 [Anaerobacillus alkaliphilus]|uniref:Uncharacterized protein n=1 Tax=Anaerobacillus alkaliphilus TaxID=1548597 RepID=A0A4Q0VKS0_9BACI|nr:hypothetical protein [Anaerobacillus alkaliphilus]RXI95564.1 hypothetical protein DS745_24240 [Anaerobacillus alkaliphilus]